MRGLAEGQSCHVFIGEAVAALIHRTRDSGCLRVDLLAWLTINAIHSERLQCVQLCWQKMCHLWRSNALQQLLRSSSAPMGLTDSVSSGINPAPSASTSSPGSAMSRFGSPASSSPAQSRLRQAVELFKERLDWDVRATVEAPPSFVAKLEEARTQHAGFLSPEDTPVAAQLVLTASDATRRPSLWSRDHKAQELSNAASGAASGAGVGAGAGAPPNIPDRTNIRGDDVPLVPRLVSKEGEGEGTVVGEAVVGEAFDDVLRRLNLDEEAVHEATRRLHTRKHGLESQLQTETEMGRDSANLDEEQQLEDDAYEPRVNLDSGMVQQAEDEAEGENEAEREQAQLAQTMHGQGGVDAREAHAWDVARLARPLGHIPDDAASPFQPLNAFVLDSAGAGESVRDACTVPLGFHPSVLCTVNQCSPRAPRHTPRCLRNTFVLLEWCPPLSSASDAYAQGVGVLVSLAEAETLRLAAHANHPALKVARVRLRFLTSGQLLDPRLWRRAQDDAPPQQRHRRAEFVADSVNMWRQCARFFDGAVWYTSAELHSLLRGLEGASPVCRTKFFTRVVQLRRRQQQTWQGSMLELAFLVDSSCRLDQCAETWRVWLQALSGSTPMVSLPARASFNQFDQDGDDFVSAHDATAALRGGATVPPEVTVDATTVRQVVTQLTRPGEPGVPFSAYATLVKGFIWRPEPSHSSGPEPVVAESSMSATQAAPDMASDPELASDLPSPCGCESTPPPTNREVSSPTPGHPDSSEEVHGVRFTMPDNEVDGMSISIPSVSGDSEDVLALPPSPRSRFLSLSRQISGASTLRKAQQQSNALRASKLGQVRHCQVTESLHLLRLLFVLVLRPVCF